MNVSVLKITFRLWIEWHLISLQTWTFLKTRLPSNRQSAWGSERPTWRACHARVQFSDACQSMCSTGVTEIAQPYLSTCTAWVSEEGTQEFIFYKLPFWFTCTVTFSSPHMRHWVCEVRESSCWHSPPSSTGSEKIRERRKNRSAQCVSCKTTTALTRRSEFLVLRCWAASRLSHDRAPWRRGHHTVSTTWDETEAGMWGFWIS